MATIGPATDSDERLEALIAGGADVMRLNFSHGTQEEHGQRIARIRAIADRLGRPVAVLQDLQGPKIRIGRLENGRPVQLDPGAEVTITTRDVVGTAERLSTTYDALARDVQTGDRLLLDDGRLRLVVLSTDDHELRARVEHGGLLAEQKGINLPGVAVSAPALTAKDQADLEFGIRHDVDYVALSFVRTAADVEQARDFLKARGARIPLIAKLEKPEAIENIDEILSVSDGVMVARGDLGVELPPEKVPPVQKMIIRRANRVSRLVITATQMLESMVSQPTPTRAEASDVANAVWDGTDAVMLSAETAIGKYPIEAVTTMDVIVREAEKHDSAVEDHPGRLTHAHAVSHAARTLAEELDVQAIVCFTRTGRTARLLSQDRPRVPILAFTSEPRIVRQLAFWWGVRPLHCALARDTDSLIEAMQQTLLQHGLAKAGQNVIVVGAIPFRAGVHTNFLKLHHIT